MILLPISKPIPAQSSSELPYKSSYLLQSYNKFNLGKPTMKIQRIPSLTTTIFALSMLFYLSLCEIVQQASPKMVKIQFQEVLAGDGSQQKVNGQMMALESFMKKMQENPASLLEMKDIYITNWTPSKPQPQEQTNRPTLSSPAPASTKQAPTVEQTRTVTQSSSSSSKVPSMAEQTRTVTQTTSTVRTPTLSEQLQAFSGGMPGNGQSFGAGGQMSVEQILASLGLGNGNIRTQIETAKSSQISSGGKSSPTVQPAPKPTPPPSSTPNPTPTPTSISRTATPPTPDLSTEPPRTANITTLREYMRKLTNKLRQKYNAGSVILNPMLCNVAQLHSNDMVNRDFFAHVNPDGENVTDRAKKSGYTGMIGENLAMAGSLDQAQNRFENSPAHFKNAINPEWEEIGFGIAWRGNGYYVTVLFIPRDLQKNKLTEAELANYKNSLNSVIKAQNPSIRNVDQKLSSLIQEWMEGSQTKQPMQYITDKGGYRTPMTASQYTVDYTNDFVDRVRNNQYFANGNPMFTRFGLGVKPEGRKLWILCVYM